MVHSEKLEYCKIQFPELKTQHLTLRAFQSTDFQDHFETISNENVTKFLDWGPYKYEEDAKDIIQILKKRLTDGKGINWALYHNQDKKVIGRVGCFWNTAHSYCEMNVETNEDYWKQGLTSGALSVICDFLFDELGFHRLQAHTKPENMATQKLFEKVGFQKEGILRDGLFWKNQFHDLVILAKINQN